MGSARWPPTTSSRVLAAVSGNFRVHAGEAHLTPERGRRASPGQAEGWSGERREESRAVKREDYISQAATLSSWSPRAPTAPQFPQGSAGPPRLCALRSRPPSAPQVSMEEGDELLPPRRNPSGA